jgi:hypothetical protein
MAEEMGFDCWEKCTGHGLCKMGITNAMTYAETNVAPVVLGASRHKNYQTSLAYQKPYDDMYRSYNRALLGRHVSSPPTKRQRKKSSDKGNVKESTDEKNYEEDAVKMDSNLISSCTTSFNDGTDGSKVTNNSVEDFNYDKNNIVTANRDVRSDGSVNPKRCHPSQGY